MHAELFLFIKRLAAHACGEDALQPMSFSIPAKEKTTKGFDKYHDKQG